MRNYINVSRIDGEFALKVLGLTLVSWAPLQVGKMLVEKFDPSIDRKIMKRAKVFTKQEEDEAQALENQAKK